MIGEFLKWAFEAHYRSQKNAGKIQDYKVTIAYENMHVEPDGMLVWDLHVKATVVPRRTVEFIQIDFVVTPQSLGGS